MWGKTRALITGCWNQLPADTRACPLHTFGGRLRHAVSKKRLIFTAPSHETSCSSLIARNFGNSCLGEEHVNSGEGDGNGSILSTLHKPIPAVTIFDKLGEV